MTRIAKTIARLEREGLPRLAAIQAARHPRALPTSTRPPGLRTGYSHPNCYAGALGDCSRKINREHYFSEALLLEIGSPIEASGFRWLKEGETRPVSAAALTAKILCERHNSALSPLDGVAKELFVMLREIDAELGDAEPPAASETFTVNGADVERWLLKVLMGAAHSHKPPDELRDEAHCLRALFGEESLRRPCGLNVDGSKDSHAFNGLSMSVLHGPEGAIWGALFNMAGLRLCLGLGEAEGAGLNYRPSGLRFEHTGRPGEKVVRLAWPEPPFSDFISYRRSRPYAGEPIDRF